MSAQSNFHFAASELTARNGPTMYIKPDFKKLDTAAGIFLRKIDNFEIKKILGVIRTPLGHRPSRKIGKAYWEYGI